MPVFFTYADELAWQTPKGEIKREVVIFVSLLVVLALECVVAVQTPGRSILVICYLACVAEDLETFLRSALSPICEKWHEALELNAVAVGSYCFDELQKKHLLSIVGPLRSKGMTADVVFLLGMKRQRKDTKYEGFATDPTLLGIHYTRARRRLYTFVHDLTSGLTLPHMGRERNRGFDLGASSNYVAEEVRAPDARHQLFYWQLKKMAADIWRNAYSMEYHQVGDNEQTWYNFLAKLISSLPFCASDVYKESLVLDLPEAVRARVPLTFYDKRHWKRILFDAKYAFVGMGQSWKPTKALNPQMKGLEHLSDASFWSECLTQPQCQARLIKDTRESDSTTQFRTSQELRNDLDVEAYSRPDGLAVFHFWQHLMLDCSTVSI